ncbi:MAG: CoA ester lyase, partial [Pseudomonadota bacterium]|nr:CoA ester lyase [Pseudomonadota bacterium]
INDAFSPTEEEVAFAQKVVDATADNFSGAIQVDGKMIDEPVIIAARRTLARAEQIASAAIG